MVCIRFFRSRAHGPVKRKESKLQPSGLKPPKLNFSIQESNREELRALDAANPKQKKRGRRFRRPRANLVLKTEPGDFSNPARRPCRRDRRRASELSFPFPGSR